MPKIRDTPPNLESLRAKLSYDPKTGIFTWTDKATPAQRGKKVTSQALPSGYHRLTFEGLGYYQHHLAWYYVPGIWPKEQIDHKDRNPGNNAFDNLREATNQENTQNSKVGQVYRYNSKWAAQLTHNGQLVYLGVYACFGKALKIRNAKKRELHPFAEAYRK